MVDADCEDRITVVDGGTVLTATADADCEDRITVVVGGTVLAAR